MSDTDAKARASASIAQAKIELDRALAEMDSIRTFNGALVGSVAHALSNYITVTVATVEMLQLSLRDYDNPDVRIWLDGIRHAADLMQHSVGRLVSVSAPREFPLKPDFVNLQTFMQRACDYFRRRSAADAIEIVCRTVGEIPLVWADRVALAVVADNLLSNAVQFSKRNSVVQVQIMAEPGHVVCSVRDEGPGLTPQQKARIFERPLPETDAVHGEPPMGFGFAVARHFIERMDGEIWCESDTGRGACFSFRLPAFE